jgi:hypothetical protein
VIRRRAGAALALALWPQAAAAHEAFGDLGPFYQALLHPLADPAQGLLVAAAAVLLGSQPIGSVRVGLAALVAAAAIGLLAKAFLPLPEPGPRAVALLVICVALVGVFTLRLGPLATGLVAAVLGAVAALPLGALPGGLPGVLTLAGGAAGITFGALFLWSGIDFVASLLSPLAPRVAAAWLAAIGVMVAAQPT